MNNKKWVIIYNPVAGGGLSNKKWRKIKQYLSSKKIKGPVYKTTIHKNAGELAYNAVKNGTSNIVCVGGDGTVHDLINGLCSQSEIKMKSVSIGIIPVGTGNDWARHYGLTGGYKKAVDIIAQGNKKSQDLGVMEVVGKKNQTVYFMNYAGVGFDGYVISKIKKYKFMGALSYLVAAVFNFISFSNFELSLIYNNKTINTSAFMLGVGLCKFTGGGMRLAYNAVPDDGLLDITIAENFTKLDVLKHIPKLFNGNLFKSRKVSTAKTNDIKVNIVKGGNFAQADGELIYGGSFSFKISEKQFCFFSIKRKIQSS